MKKMIGIIILALQGIAFAQTIHTNPKKFQLATDNSGLFIEGSWRRTSSRPTIEIPAANSFRVECIRSSGLCREYVAVLITPEEGAPYHMEGSQLFMNVQTFKIQQWDAKTLVAKAEPRAADIFLRVSLADRTAERTSQETNARGATGASPGVDAWRFEMKAR
jgi:hypothetical protein